MNPNNDNNNDAKRGTIMIGSDFFGGRRDSMDSQASSRRGSLDAPLSGGAAGDAAAQAQQQSKSRQRGRFWPTSIGAAQLDCASAPFSA